MFESTRARPSAEGSLALRILRHKQYVIIILVEGIFNSILRLIDSGTVNISDHGYDELTADDLFVREIFQSVHEAVVIEEYPDYSKGPCVLVLQKDRSGNPVHVVWGIPKGKSSPAVLVTSYRPDPNRWDKDFIRRKK